MHRSDNVPYVRPIADQTFAPDHEAWDSCWAGAWNLIISKPTISECNGNLYTIWTQFNDPKNGIIDDCADRAWKHNDREGSANGDLWVSVSTNGGMTWDYQRNLTNTYTPHCDPRNDVDCQSDSWASMNRFGRLVGAGENWAWRSVVDPSGTYTGDHYLDIQYLEDRDAGAIVQSEGTWTNNPMHWFRMACVDPIPAADIHLRVVPSRRPDLREAGCIPGHRPCRSRTSVTPRCTYGVSVDETPSAIAPGWLGVTNFSGVLPCGLAGIEVGDIRLNVNQETITGNYFATMTFQW